MTDYCFIQHGIREELEWMQGSEDEGGAVEEKNDASRHDLFEGVLGHRFRGLRHEHQADVLEAVGSDDAYSCPVAVCYGVIAWNRWSDLHPVTQDFLTNAGVIPGDYEEFIHWHDGAWQELADLRAWLRAQMDGHDDANRL